VLYEGKVYVGGGDETKVESHRIDIFDPASNSWDPNPINTLYCLFAMTIVNKQLITAGGIDENDKVTNKVFSLDGDELKEYTRMITPRCDATAAGHHEVLIIAGGKLMDDQYEILVASKITELFNSTTGQWYSSAHLPLPHSELQSVIVNNVLYLLGGSDITCFPSPAVFTVPLNTLLLKWDSHQDTPWCYSAPVNVFGRHLLALGGRNTENQCTSDIHLFNRASNSWKVIGQLPSVKHGVSAVTLTENKILVIGGYDGDQFTNTVWIGSFEP